MPTQTFTLPRTDAVVFGAGAFGSVADHVEAAGGTRVLAVVSGALAGGPVEERLRTLLGSALVAVHSRTAQHVPASSVLDAAAMARQHRADCVVSVGGGSPIDCAKGVALALGTGVEDAAGLARYRVRFTYPDTVTVPAIDGELLPHIAVPTTLSGGEHTALCGITDDATREKAIYKGAALQPRVVLLDPQVTVATPDWLWASSGMRAVDHAVEGILSARHMPLSDALGVAALRLLAANLVHSATHPHDEAARLDCLVGAWLSIFGLADVGSGLSHGIGHQLAAEFDIVHGVTSAIMLPRVMEFTREQTAPRMRMIAEALGVATPATDDRTAADLAVAAVRELTEQLGVPTTISAAGGAREALPGLAERIMHDSVVATCPRPVTRQDVLDILESAW